MAASAADVRSALSLPAPSQQPASAPPKQAKPRKPEGISRELYALIGPNAPSLAQPTKPRFKAKPNLGGGASVKWEQREFTNRGRKDGLRLTHWVKASSDPNEEYPFAKYNISSTAFSYTDVEYESLLKSDVWTREETDYLFSLMHEYDSRWYVVHDRYDFPGGPKRTLEELKDRYCSCSRKLMRTRPWTGDEATKQQIMQSLAFDLEKENMRKKYLSSLLERTPEQIAEEEALYLELKRLEQTERRFRREREDLLRKLLGVDSGLPELAQDDEGPGAVASALNTSGLTDGKKRKRGGEVDSPVTPAVSSTLRRRSGSARSAEYDAMHCIYRTVDSGGEAPTKTAHVAAFLRSYKLPVPKAAILPRIAQALVELGTPVTGPGIPYPPTPPEGDERVLHALGGALCVAPSGASFTPRLVMPTRENCARLERLVDGVGTLVETKRGVDRVEQEMAVLRERARLRELGEDGMEGLEDGREGSVVSEVGGMGGRKQKKASRRSMSVSSVDTTATSGRRKGRK